MPDPLPVAKLIIWYGHSCRVLVPSCQDSGSTNEIAFMRIATCPKDYGPHTTHYVTMLLSYISKLFGSNDGDYFTWKSSLESYRGVHGYTSLRENQLLVIKHFMRSCDVFVSMPTYSEKSLCNC